MQAVNLHKPRLLFMGLAMIWPQAGCIQLFSATALSIVHSANQVVKQKVSIKSQRSLTQTLQAQAYQQQQIREHTTWLQRAKPSFQAA